MLIYRNAEGAHSQRKFDNTCPKPKSSPVATGGFRGFIPPSKAPSDPEIETWNTTDQWSFCQCLECQATSHKRKAPLLKTFWRRFCLNLGDSDRPQTNVFVALVHNMVHWFAWKQVKHNISRTVKWRELQQNITLPDFETLQNQKFSPNWRADRSGPEWRHRFKNCLRTVSKPLADCPKTGLLAARAISGPRIMLSLFFMRQGGRYFHPFSSTATPFFGNIFYRPSWFF